VRYPSPLVEGSLVRRYKRFLADVRLDDGSEVTAWCPTPGRMTTCLADDAPVRLSRSDSPARKLPWTLEQIFVDGWVLTHPGRSNAVVGEGIAAGRVRGLTGEVHHEQRLGDHRIDLLLVEEGRRTWVEVKSVTLLRGDRVLFPDAVTQRGARHLDALARAARAGDRAVLFWLVVREGGTSVGPADDVDPDYGRALRAAVEAGVEVLAYRSRHDESGIELGEPLPVLIP